MNSSSDLSTMSHLKGFSIEDRAEIMVIQCASCRSAYQIIKKHISTKETSIRCKKCGENILVSHKMFSKKQNVKQTRFETSSQNNKITTDSDHLRNLTCQNDDYSPEKVLKDAPQCNEVAKDKNETKKSTFFLERDRVKSVRKSVLTILVISQLLGFISYFIETAIPTEWGIWIFAVSALAVSAFVIYRYIYNTEIKLFEYLKLILCYFILICICAFMTVMAHDCFSMMVLFDIAFILLLSIGILPKFVIPYFRNGRSFSGKKFEREEISKGVLYPNRSEALKPWKAGSYETRDNHSPTSL